MNISAIAVTSTSLSYTFQYRRRSRGYCGQSIRMEMEPDSSLQCIRTKLVCEPERLAAAGHGVPRPGVRWHLQHPVTAGTAYAIDLPQGQPAFPAHELEGEAGTAGALKAVTCFETTHINLFSAAGTGEG